MTPNDELEAQSLPASDAENGQEVAPPKRKRGRPRKPDNEKAPRKKTRRASFLEEMQQAPEGTAWDALKNPEQYALPPQMRGFAAQQAQYVRGDAPREQMNIRVHAELKRAAQILAAAKNVSLGDIVEAALIDYIKKQQ